MTKACEEKLVLTAPQMKDLFKLGLAGVRQTERVAPSQETLRTIWRPSTWDVLCTKVASSQHFKASAALQTMCLQMAKLSKGTTLPPKPKIVKGKNNVESVPAKRKADRSGDDGDGDTAAATKAKRKKAKKAKV
jgi:DNA polymerase phi